MILTNPKKIKVLVEIDENLLKKIDDIRKTKKITRRKIFEYALNELLKNEELEK